MGRARRLKRLRRAAERITPGKPRRRLESFRGGLLKNDPQTERGMYRMVKKGTAREAARRRQA